jgi:hypothetical protein
VRKVEGGVVYTAETDQAWWAILDEGTMADFLDPEDAVLAGVTLERYDTRADRQSSLARRGITPR